MPELRPSERRIASYFVSNPRDAAMAPIGEVAQKCQTSTTSVVRFSKRFGYQHLRALRHDVLRDALREEVITESLPESGGDLSPGASMREVVDNIRHSEVLSINETADALDLTALRAAIDALATAQRIVIFGLGASSFVGLDLQQKLIRIGVTALNCPDPHGAWTVAATLDDQAVAVAISHSGTTRDTVEFLQIAARHEAATIAITNHDSSALAAAAEVVLTTAARETQMRSGALGSRIAQLMVVDCLFLGLAQRDYERSATMLKQTWSAVHERGLHH